jgi:hypothetical protein
MLKLKKYSKKVKLIITKRKKTIGINFLTVVRKGCRRFIKNQLNKDNLINE